MESFVLQNEEMAHTAFILGRIEGPYKNEDASAQNLKVLSTLPENNDWPWLDGSMFSVPKRYTLGGVRTQLIHFGCSIKDDFSDEKPRWFDDWCGKFENLLFNLTWHSAFILLERDAGQVVEATYLNTMTDQSTRRHEIRRGEGPRVKAN